MYMCTLTQTLWCNKWEDEQMAAHRRDKFDINNTNIKKTKPNAQQESKTIWNVLSMGKMMRNFLSFFIISKESEYCVFIGIKREKWTAATIEKKRLINDNTTTLLLSMDMIACMFS